MSYESPITVEWSNTTIEQLRDKYENLIVRAVRQFFPTVDKEELAKALEYDRGQYQKGYADGVAEERARWMGKVKTLILVIALLSVASFFLNAGLVWVVCWAFGWTWSWKICLAVWALEWMLSLTFHKSGRAE